KQRLLQRSSEEKLYANLLRLKYDLEDYTNGNEYDKDKSTSYYLSEYLKITGRNQKELSADIDVHPTRLSRILNDNERLSLSIAYRLERHSGDIIPSILWWKLIQKDIEQEIIKGTEEKEKEKDRVKHVVFTRA
ncbi:MAG: hypothetical protein AAFO07_06680, partial [Bacteroidota bacterium]